MLFCEAFNPLLLSNVQGDYTIIGLKGNSLKKTKNKTQRSVDLVDVSRFLVPEAGQIACLNMLVKDERR